MQSTAGTSLPASRTANRAARCRVTIQWNGSTWADESGRLISANGTMESINMSEGILGIGAGKADSATLYLDNNGKRYCDWYSDGALYDWIQNGNWKGTPVRIQLGYDDASGNPEYVYVHRGYIDEITTYITSRGHRAQIRSVDKAGYWLQHQSKSPLYHNYRTDEFMQVLVNLLPVAIRPTLTADIGLFNLPWCWIDDENIWQEMSRLAEAEGGRIYFAPTDDNTLLFENATHFLLSPHTGSVATFAITDWQQLVVPASFQNYWNHVIVDYTPYRLAPRQVLWQHTGEILAVKPGATETVTARFDKPAWVVDDPVGDVDMIAVTSGGTRLQFSTDDEEYITVNVTTWAQQAELEIINNLDMTAFFVRLRLMGRPVESGDTEQVEATASGDLVDKAGKRTKHITGNPYIQTKEHAQALADFMLERGQEVRKAPPLVNLDGMPWLEIGDRVTVTEQGSTSLGDFFVNQIPWKWESGKGMSMSPVCMPAGLFAYDDYFILGTNTLGSGSSLPGRAFY